MKTEKCPTVRISIHPPRVVRDAILYLDPTGLAVFQSTLPVWGGTGRYSRCNPLWYRFQSTLPVWGGTNPIQRVAANVPYFNPPSPCGEGRTRSRKTEPGRRISIHPPRVGRDWRKLYHKHSVFRHFNPPSPCGEGPGILSLIYTSLPFQSTLPVWGGTDLLDGAGLQGGISIHPPRVGRDSPSG